MSAAPASSCLTPRRGRPSNESLAELELIAIKAEIADLVSRCDPSLDRLERATWEMGPSAHQTVMYIRYQLDRMRRRHLSSAR